MSSTSRRAATLLAATLLACGAVVTSPQAAVAVEPRPGIAPIGHRSSSAASSAARVTSLTISKPTGTEVDDVLLARVSNRNDVNSVLAAPPGWKLARGDKSTFSISTRIYYKVATAAEPASYRFTVNTPRWLSGTISAFRGVDTTRPIDSSTGQYNRTTPTFATAALITNSADAIAVWFGTQVWTGNNCPNPSITPPTGFTEPLDSCLLSTTSGLIYDIAQRTLTTAGRQPVWCGSSTFRTSNLTQVVALRQAKPNTAADSYAPSSVDVGSINVPDGVLHEPSGLAASRINPNVLYAHGEAERGTFIALQRNTAAVLGRFRISVPAGALFDWEDIAVGPCPTGSCIYVGDIGSAKNGYAPPADFDVFRLPEPDLAGRQTSGTLIAERFRFDYPDGHYNAEALLVHPTSGDIYVITKTQTGASGVYKFPNPLPAASDTRITVLSKVTTLRLPVWTAGPTHKNRWYAQTTAASIHPVGDRFLLRTPYVVYEYRATGAFETAFAAAPVTLTTPTGEGQGEAIEYAVDGSAYYTLGEREAPPFVLKRVDRR